MKYFSLKAIAVIFTAMLMNSHLALAASTNSKANLFVVQDSRFAVAEHDALLSKVVIDQLQTDDKLTGYIQVSNRNGAISISGKVDSVSMIFRIFEITKDLPGVEKVDVSQLDT